MRRLEQRWRNSTFNLVKISSFVLLEKAGSSAMLLSDPTQGGRNSRRDRAIDVFLSLFMADICNTMTQVDSATSLFFSWVIRLAESVSGKRLLEACDRYNLSWAFRRTYGAGFGGADVGIGASNFEKSGAYGSGGAY